MLTQPEQQCSSSPESDRQSSTPSGRMDCVKFVEGKLRTPRRDHRFLKFALAAPLAALGLSGLSACASSSEYMGISLKPGAAAIELQDLARRAQAGDKLAQLELGIQYEEGRGVPVDIGRAKRLYNFAASDSGGTVWIYSPPVGSGTRGRVIRVGTGPRQAGLAEARARLMRMRR